MSPLRSSAAVAAWSTLLGNEPVIADAANCESIATATFDVTRRVTCVLTISSRSELQQCVRIANEFRVPIYPISQGKNWGLGSKVPSADDCAVVDLSELNRIVDFNDELGHITVEPGVTFRQVSDFLKQQGGRWFVAVTGSSPDGSLIGNLAERGEGNGPYGDRLAHATNLEVLLPTGEWVHTGLGRFATAQAQHVHNYGVGPAFDGFFTQSNFGIITQATIWLMPTPADLQLFRIRIIERPRLIPALNMVQQLMMTGALRSNCFTFWNSYKLLARLGSYPWKVTKQTTPLHLQALKGHEPWYGNGAIYSASSDLGAAAKQHVQQQLSPLVDEIEFIDGLHDPEIAGENLFLGEPSDANIRSTYWRKRTLIPADTNPDRDRCGVIWLCPVFPAIGSTVSDGIELIESTIRAHTFEPNVSVNFRDARCVQVFVAIMYDRDVDGEDQRAMACHDQLFQALLARGHFPCRLGIQSMTSLPPPRDVYNLLVEKIKQALDPNNILAPGRYDFREPSPT